MQNYFEKALQENEQFALAMVDIDYFKKINDTYGHDTGDKVINAVADVLRANTSQNDMVARFGGEEFCVVLKNINPSKALEVFEKLRAKIEKCLITATNGATLSCTASIGVLVSPEESLEESINQADMLLYSAKQQGRNRVVSN